MLPADPAAPFSPLVLSGAYLFGRKSDCLASPRHPYVRSDAELDRLARGDHRPYASVPQPPPLPRYTFAPEGRSAKAEQSHQQEKQSRPRGRMNLRQRAQAWDAGKVAEELDSRGCGQKEPAESAHQRERPAPREEQDQRHEGQSSKAGLRWRRTALGEGPRPNHKGE